MMALAGVAAVWYGTAQGIGVFSDSVIYLDGAAHLLRGQGFASSLSGDPMPIVQFMPLFSALIAAVAKLGPDVPLAARLVNTACFGGTVALSAWLLAQISPTRSPWPLIGTAAVAFSERMIHLHSNAWSEPLFILLMLASLAAMIRYRRGEGAGWWWLSLAAAALACLGRYVGLALVGAGAVTSLFGRDAETGRRVWRPYRGVAFSLAAAPTLAWMLRNVTRQGAATNRRIAWHPVSGAHWREMVLTVGSYLGGEPLELGWMAAGIAAVALAAGIWLHAQLDAQRRGMPSDGVVWRTIAIYAASYFAALLISISVLDDTTTLNMRHLAALYVPLVALVLVALQAGLARLDGQRRRAAIGLLVVCWTWWMARQAYGAQGWSRWAHDEGLGFHEQAWQTSDAVAWLRALPNHVPVITTEPRGIYYLTGQPVIWLPYAYHAVTGKPLDDYAARLAPIKQALADGALLLYLDNAPPRYASQADLINQLDLCVRHELAHGTVYASNPVSP